MRVERVVLEHHGDVAIHGSKFIDDLAVNRNVAGADGLEPGNHAQRRGLAAARRAHEHQELLVADLQIDIFDGVHGVVELVDAP